MELTPLVRSTYKILLEKITKFGDIRVEEKKTSIHIANRAAFAGVHPRKEYFILTIVSSVPIKSQRIIKQEQVSKSRFHNEIRIESKEDINKELINWLQEAYALMA